MRKILGRLGKYVSLLLYGISTMTLQPNVDYMVHVSSADDITRKSWERTGNMLRNTISEYEVKYVKKQSTTSTQG